MKSPEFTPSEAMVKRADAIEAYIKKIAHEYKGAGEEREDELKRIWGSKSAKEKADELYDSMLAFMLFKKERAEKRKQALAEGREMEETKPSSRLISRIKVLSEDPAVTDLLPETYGRARVEGKEIDASEIVKDWGRLNMRVEEKERQLWDSEGRLLQQKVSRPDELKELKSEVEEIAEIVSEDRKAQEALESLADMPATPENADAAAMLHYERLSKYRREQDEGFVWLPSRQKIVDEAMRVLREGSPEQTKLGVWLISEPGTGKTELIRAASKKLTGMDRVKVDCGPRTGDKEFFGEQKVFPNAENPAAATYYDFRNTITAAWTGYDHSYDTEPARPASQVVELDEMPKLFENEVAFSKIKNLFSLRDGDEMNGKKVLPGRILFASGNVGTHHNNKQIPPALERHFKVIPVDYPEMSKENPELYEFMVAALMEKGGLPAAKEDIEPKYVSRELPENERQKLEDGSVVVGVEELVEDPTHKEHGYLYRLAHAVKAVQDAYMARGGENEFVDYANRPRLRSKTNDQTGEEYITETGTALTLSTTITLQDISGWVETYKSQLAKKGSLTLSEWMQGKLKDKMGEKYSESEKLNAIFNHFHLFDADQSSAGKEAKPLTPKEIGYLSPRVPRPVKVEKPAVEAGESQESAADKELAKEVREYETKQVSLEDGSAVWMKDREYTFDIGSYNLDEDKLGPFELVPGTKFKIGNDTFVFSGIVEDENSPYNGKLVAKFLEEELYRVFSDEEAGLGLHNEFKDSYTEKTESIRSVASKYWEKKCVGNAKNNPDNISAPVW